MYSKKLTFSSFDTRHLEKDIKLILESADSKEKAVYYFMKTFQPSSVQELLSDLELGETGNTTSSNFTSSNSPLDSAMLRIKSYVKERSNPEKQKIIEIMKGKLEFHFRRSVDDQKKAFWVFLAFEVLATGHLEDSKKCKRIASS